MAKQPPKRTKDTRAKSKTRARPRRGGSVSKNVDAASGLPEYLLNEFPEPVAKAFAPLSIVNRRFVVYYCTEAHGNATLATELAGVGERNGEKDIASQSYIARASRGSQLLRQPEIRKAIDAWMQAFAMSAAEITWQFKDLTQVNPGPFFEVNAEGTLVLRPKMDRQDWEAFKHWIKEIEVDAKGVVTRVILHDKVVALDRMAKILKLYTDQPIFAFNLYVQQLGDDQLLNEINAARAEEEQSIGQQPRLPPGPPVAEVPPPEAEDDV